jgi:hypothetical protein
MEAGPFIVLRGKVPLSLIWQDSLDTGFGGISRRWPMRLHMV